MTIDCVKKDFVIKGATRDGQNLYQLYQEAYTQWELYQVLFEEAEKKV